MTLKAGWTVWCLDDIPPSGERTFVRATSKTFATIGEAVAYLKTVATSREPELRQAEPNPEAYVCADCDDRGFGGWNCNRCGSHNLIRA